MKTALFVDFDNIYIELLGIDRRAAKCFAESPSSWTQWLLDNSPASQSEAPEKRRFLIRSCYLTPQQFARFRPNFTRAGFQVIDCPPLTASNKNGADIRMVIDILDTLHHQTCFDEFIILSGDSDFTPLLHRLREFDRRTVVLTVGQGAAAYRNAADHVIMGSEEFLDALMEGHEVLQASPPPPTFGIPRPAADPVEVMAQRLAKIAGERGAPIYIGELPKLIFTGLHDKTQSWFGFGSLYNLSQHLVRLAGGLKIVTDKHGSSVNSYVVLSGDSDATLDAPLDQSAVSSYVAERVQTSPHPVNMALLAQEVLTRFPGVKATGWFGHSSFGRFLELECPSVRYSPIDSGVMYHPQTHGELSVTTFDEEIAKALASFVNSFVAAAELPVPMATLAQEAQLKFPGVKGANWLGYGTFKGFIGARCPEVRYSTENSGILFMPERHGAHVEQLALTAEAPSAFSDYSPELKDLARRVGNITGAPYLAPHQIARFMEGVAAYVTEKEFQFNDITKQMRDQSQVEGWPIPRSAANFLIQGIYKGGIDLREEKPTAQQLREAYFANLLQLLESSEYELELEERDLLREWIFGDPQALSEAEAAQGHELEQAERESIQESGAALEFIEDAPSEELTPVEASRMSPPQGEDASASQAAGGDPEEARDGDAPSEDAPKPQA